MRIAFDFWSERLHNPTKMRETLPDSLPARDDFTFESFVVESCNAFTVAACQAIIEQPGEVNPFYIHGRTGIGKTHLIHAIANALLAAGRRKIVLRTGESLVNDLIAAIRARTLDAFRDKCLNADVLIIDDIQCIAGKKSTQKELFHTFNALYENKKQIILTSDRSPEEFPDLMECLHSRFGGGLIVELPLPDLGARLAFISRKADLAGIALSDESVSVLVSRTSCNFRSLEGAWTSLIAHSALTGRAIEPGFVKEVLGDPLQDGWA